MRSGSPQEVKSKGSPRSSRQATYVIGSTSRFEDMPISNYFKRVTFGKSDLGRVLGLVAMVARRSVAPSLPRRTILASLVVASILAFGASTASAQSLALTLAKT